MPSSFLRGHDVEAIAICFLNSFTNPDHERRTRELVEEQWPGVFVCTSVEVLPELLEFERTSTTVANAYVGPIISRYLASLEEDDGPWLPPTSSSWVRPAG